jgi:hypothetical protein
MFHAMFNAPDVDLSKQETSDHAGPRAMFASRIALMTASLSSALSTSMTIRAAPEDF